MDKWKDERMNGRDVRTGTQLGVRAECAPSCISIWICIFSCQAFPVFQAISCVFLASFHFHYLAYVRVGLQPTSTVIWLRFQEGFASVVQLGRLPRQRLPTTWPTSVSVSASVAVPVPVPVSSSVSVCLPALVVFITCNNCGNCHVGCCCHS